MKMHRFSTGYLVYHWMQTLVFLVIFLLLAAVNIAMFRVAKRQLQAIQAAHIESIDGLVDSPTGEKKEQLFSLFISLLHLWFSGFPGLDAKSTNLFITKFWITLTLTL